MYRFIPTCALAAVAAVPISAQTTAETSMADPAAIERTLNGVYEVISGPAGKARDWNAMRGMFTPDARLYSVSARGLSGGSLEDYISRAGPNLVRVGFTERELARRVEIYGNLAQVWSSYAGTSTDGSVKVRGINSFQLARQPDGRWLVHSILWQAEAPGLKLPADMEERE